MGKNIYALGRMMLEESMKLVEIVKVTQPETMNTDDQQVIERATIATALFVVPLFVTDVLLNFAEIGIDVQILAMVTTYPNSDTGKPNGLKLHMPEDLRVEEYKAMVKFNASTNATWNQIITKGLNLDLLGLLVPRTALYSMIMTFPITFVKPELNDIPVYPYDPAGYFKTIADLMWQKIEKTEITTSDLHLPLLNSGSDPYALKMRFVEQLAGLMSPADTVKKNILHGWHKTGSIDRASSHLKKWNQEKGYWEYLNPFPMPVNPAREKLEREIAEALETQEKSEKKVNE